MLENRSGRPLARSRVSLETIRSDGRVNNTVALTDSGGRFRFAGLPSGVYRLKVERRGYLRSYFGQRRWNGGGTPISLDRDSQFFADIRMQKLATVTGEIVDENGVGMPGIAVIAFRADKFPLRSVASATTDDRGVYRLGVQPGLYYVASGATRLEDGRGLLTTFVGQVTRARDASPVEVAADEEQALLSIEPVPGRLGSLSGTVQGGLAASVTLYTDTGKREARVEPGGTFSFEALAPGTYPLIASSESRPEKGAYVKVQVEGAQNIVLNLAPLATIRMRAEDGGRQIESDRVFAVLVTNEPFGTFTVPLQRGETQPLAPGDYTVYGYAPVDSCVESVHVSSGERTTPSEVVEAVPGQTLDLTISVRSSAAQMTGTVTTPDGHPAPGAHVFIKPVEKGRRILAVGGDRTTAGSSGEYTIYSLLPGRYRVFSSFEILEPSAADWESPAVATVTLGEKQKLTQDLKVAGTL